MARHVGHVSCLRANHRCKHCVQQSMLALQFKRVMGHSLQADGATILIVLSCCITHFGIINDAIIMLVRGSFRILFSLLL